MSADSGGIPDLDRKVAKGAVWMVASRFAVRAIGVVNTVIVARLLTPYDFGLVSLTMAILAAVDIFTNLSFDTALIRETRATREDYDTVWTLSVFRGALIALAFAMLAIPAAQFFHDSRMQAVMYAFALSTFLEGFQNVGIVDFRKHLRFHQEFLFGVVGKFAAAVITVAVAFWWRSYWALVFGIIVNRMSGVILSYVMNDFRPRAGLARWKTLFHFSKWLLVSNVINFFSAKLDVFVLGRLAGTMAVGLYEIAFEIANLPTGELVWPIQRAFLPGYAKIQENTSHLARSYVGGFSAILFIALPAGAGIAAIAPLAVNVFLGQHWLAAIPIMQVLSVAGIIRIMHANAGSVLLALGKARALSAMAGAGFAFLIPAVIGGATLDGPIGVAWAIVAFQVVFAVMAVSITLKLLSISLSSVAASTWRTFSSGAIMVLSVTFSQAWLEALNILPMKAAELFVLIVIGITSYSGSHLILWVLARRPEGPEHYVLNLILPTIERLRPRPVRA